jgi:uncharacterized protein GlcG (DUF336 family)
VDGYSVSAAVTVRSGILLALVRSEKAGAHNADASKQKAFTSASSRSATSTKVENVAGNLRVAGLADIPVYLVLASGFPIQVDDKTIGAVDIAGAPNGRLDEDCANIAIAASSEAPTTIRFSTPACTGSVTLEIDDKWRGIACSGP